MYYIHKCIRFSALYLFFLKINVKSYYTYCLEIYFHLIKYYGYPSKSIHRSNPHSSVAAYFIQPFLRPSFFCHCKLWHNKQSSACILICWCLYWYKVDSQIEIAGYCCPFEFLPIWWVKMTFCYRNLVIWLSSLI